MEKIFQNNWIYIIKTKIFNTSCVTWIIVQENLNKPWNYEELSKNNNITWEIVQENLDKPWNYKELSKNQNIETKIIEV